MHIFEFREGLDAWENVWIDYLPLERQLVSPRRCASFWFPGCMGG
jgi:hypothetical protein